MISKWNDNWIVNCLRSAFRRRVNAAACKTIMAFESLQTLPDTSLFFLSLVYFHRSSSFSELNHDDSQPDIWRFDSPYSWCRQPFWHSRRRSHPYPDQGWGRRKFGNVRCKSFIRFMSFIPDPVAPSIDVITDGECEPYRLNLVLHRC